MNVADFISQKQLFLKGRADVKSRLSNNRSVNTQKLYQEWFTLLAKDEQPLKQAEFEETLLSQLQAERQQRAESRSYTLETVSGPDQLVKQAIEAEGFQIDGKGEQITLKGCNSSAEALAVAVRRYNYFYTRDSKEGKEFTREVYSNAEVENCLLYYLQNRDLHARLSLREQLEYSPEAGADNWLALTVFDIVNRYEVAGDRELAATMLMHFLWQTKRYIYGLEVIDPVFFNIFGVTQGTGKSFFVSQLVSLFKSYTSKATIASMTDSRESARWTENYIVRFEELTTGNLDRKDIGNVIATIKQLLTSDTISYRQMRQTKFITQCRTFSAIGDSNFSIVDLLADRSGMRRFFEMECKCGLCPDRIKFLHRLDVLRMWKAVDQNCVGYLLPGSPLYSKLKDVQAGYKKMLPVDYAMGLFDSDCDMVDYRPVTDSKMKGKTEAELIKLGFRLEDLFQVRRCMKDYLIDKCSDEMAKYLPEVPKLRAFLMSDSCIVITKKRKDMIVVEDKQKVEADSE